MVGGYRSEDGWLGGTYLERADVVRGRVAGVVSQVRLLLRRRRRRRRQCRIGRRHAAARLAAVPGRAAHRRAVGGRVGHQTPDGGGEPSGCPRRHTAQTQRRRSWPGATVTVTDRRSSSDDRQFKRPYRAYRSTQNQFQCTPQKAHTKNTTAQMTPMNTVEWKSRGNKLLQIGHDYSFIDLTHMCR